MKSFVVLRNFRLLTASKNDRCDEVMVKVGVQPGGLDLFTKVEEFFSFDA